MITILTLVIGFVLVMPSLVLLHEIGHAAPILIAGEKVEIALGSSDLMCSLTIGDLTIRTNLLPLNIGFYSTQVELTKLVNIVSTLGGPLVSLICALTLFALSKAIEGQVLLFLVRFGAWFAAFQFLFTSLPVQYSDWFMGYAGVESDGLRLFRLLRSGT